METLNHFNIFVHRITAPHTTTDVPSTESTTPNSADITTQQMESMLTQVPLTIMPTTISIDSIVPETRAQ